MRTMLPSLSGLRRSLLGAWLAAAYALAVLAAALAPAPALAAATGLAGAMLCSGAAMPGQDAPHPAEERLHCKGCPLQPLLAAPEPPRAIPASRSVTHLAFALRADDGLPRGMPEGLAQPRAPPSVFATTATLP